MPAFVVAAVLALNPWDLGDEVCPGDLARFPADALLAVEYHSLAADHVCWIETYTRFVPWMDSYEWGSAARRSGAAWEHLSNAWVARNSDHPNSMQWVVGDLRKLRDVIGIENYRAGMMPDPIPYRRLMPTPAKPPSHNLHRGNH